jgi:hypothetical protein
MLSREILQCPLGLFYEKQDTAIESKSTKNILMFFLIELRVLRFKFWAFFYLYVITFFKIGPLFCIAGAGMPQIFKSIPFFKQ